MASETCPRCGRASWSGDGPDGETCVRTDGLYCRIARAAYLRGLREGVEVAKDHATPVVAMLDEEYIDWSYVDAEIARREAKASR